MQLLFCGSGWPEVPALLARRLGPDHHLRAWDRRRPLVDELAAAPVDVLLPSNAPVDAAVLAAAAAGGLRLVQQPAAGTDGIDLAAARAHGVPVCNAPGANQVAVAEAALLLLLLCARRWPEARAAFAAGVIGSPPGTELAGATLLVVGPGRTGGALVERARALGMVVRTAGSRTTRAELLVELARADAVCLSCPLSPATRGLLDARALATLPAHALVVNVARGAVIDRDALVAALDRGHLGGVGLDVFWEEPWDPADPLFAHPRVVTLPHVAGSTTQAFDRIADIVVDNVGRLQRGEGLRHRIA